MKRSLMVVLMMVIVVISSFAMTKAFQVSVTDTTGVSVPVTMTMFQVRNLMGVTFPANWQSLRVYQNGKEIPYQIDDVDMNGHISGPDILAFCATGPVTIKVSDDVSISAPHYPNLFKVSKNDMGEYMVSAINGVLKAIVSDHGLVNITKFGKITGDIVDQIGIARINGFPHSTYWANGKVGDNAEQTSDAFKVVYMKVLGNSPVRLTILTKLEAMPFVGLYQYLITSIYPDGDVLVDTTFDFMAYADLMKLQVMITHPLSNLEKAGDAVHMLPVFRRLVWADQQGISPLEYWLERNSIVYVNSLPYIVFPFSNNMKPPYWGATYIFASEENWRSNFSQDLGLGVAEILPHTAPLYDDYSKWMKGNTWVYESQEFRDGQFEWTPGEFYTNPITKSILNPSNTPTQWAKLAIHYIPGEQVKFTRLYSVYNAKSIISAIQYLVQRTREFRSIKISK